MLSEHHLVYKEKENMFGNTQSNKMELENGMWVIETMNSIESKTSPWAITNSELDGMNLEAVSKWILGLRSLSPSSIFCHEQS